MAASVMPATRAMSRTVVRAKPRSEKRRREASRIWWRGARPRRGRRRGTAGPRAGGGPGPRAGGQQGRPPPGLPALQPRQHRLAKAIGEELHLADLVDDDEPRAG